MKLMINKAEIIFWNMAIGLMTHSPSVRLVTSKTGRFLQHKTYLLYSAIVGFWGFTGLVTGLMLGRFGISLH